MKEYTFDLILHDGTSYQGHNYSAHLDNIKKIVVADSPEDAERQARLHVDEVNSRTKGNWWTSSKIEEVKS